MVLRLFVFLWEVGAGTEEKPPELIKFLTWAMCPLFVAGPLLRYSQWPSKLVPHHLHFRRWSWWRAVLVGAAMAVGGLLLVSVPRLTGSRSARPTTVDKLLSVFLYGPWGFYLSIAGAFIVLEALGRLGGIKVGPSFDEPFFQRNIADFWSRWNTTATAVFRELLFYNRWGGQKFNPYLNALIVFLAVGLWHGSNVYWLSFGLLHGLYFCVYLWMRSRFPRARLPRALGVAMTYAAVCVAWYIPSKIAGLLPALRGIQ
jgi:D-alanyl-lipoteichoic acid acyltransferase DltB (MBOAT superfamily)